MRQSASRSSPSTTYRPALERVRFRTRYRSPNHLAWVIARWTSCHESGRPSSLTRSSINCCSSGDRFVAHHTLNSRSGPRPCPPPCDPRVGRARSRVKDADSLLFPELSVPLHLSNPVLRRVFSRISDRHRPLRSLIARTNGPKSRLKETQERPIKYGAPLLHVGTMEGNIRNVSVRADNGKRVSRRSFIVTLIRRK
jgi:hypothetical protein